MQEDRNGKHNWTFLTNHAHVLLCLARGSSVRMKDIAQEVGITERAVQLIVADLEESGYIERTREGRCNVYRVHGHSYLRHPIEKHKSIEDLIRLIHGEQVQKRPHETIQI